MKEGLIEYEIYYALKKTILLEEWLSTTIKLIIQVNLNIQFKQLK